MLFNYKGKSSLLLQLFFHSTIDIHLYSQFFFQFIIFGFQSCQLKIIWFDESFGAKLSHFVVIVASMIWLISIETNASIEIEPNNFPCLPPVIIRWCGCSAFNQNWLQTASQRLGETYKFPISASTWSISVHPLRPCEFSTDLSDKTVWAFLLNGCFMKLVGNIKGNLNMQQAVQQKENGGFTLIHDFELKI